MHGIHSSSNKKNTQTCPNSYNYESTVLWTRKGGHSHVSFNGRAGNNACIIQRAQKKKREHKSYFGTLYELTNEHVYFPRKKIIHCLPTVNFCCTHCWEWTKLTTTLRSISFLYIIYFSWNESILFPYRLCTPRRL